VKIRYDFYLVLTIIIKIIYHQIFYKFQGLIIVLFSHNYSLLLYFLLCQKIHHLIFYQIKLF